MGSTELGLFSSSAFSPSFMPPVSPGKLRLRSRNRPTVFGNIGRDDVSCVSCGTYLREGESIWIPAEAKEEEERKRGHKVKEAGGDGF
jgi:hypothetical protein